MEGLSFIYSSWLLVIILLFFVSNHKQNSILIHVLMILFLSQFSFTYQGITINTSIIYLVIITCLNIERQPFFERVQLYLVSFILALLQGSYQLYFILEPLWFKWIPSWFICFITVYICSLLVTSHSNRILSLIMGTLLSDVLLFIIHQQNRLVYDFLQIEWLDQLASVAVMYFLISTIEIIGKYFFANSRHIHKKEV